MEQKSPREMTFLIVDDMDNMRRSIKAMLKLINYGKEFFEAGNGRDAWKFLKDNPQKIDFIICDYAMPYMTGTELLYQIRLDKILRDIPFMMITAEANMEIVAEAAEQDVDGYLTKPFVTASLEHKIDELLKKVFNPDPFIKHLRAARDFEEKGEVTKAIEEARLALKENERSSRPYRELGRLYFKAGKVKDSLSFFTRATEINRLDVSSYHYLGQIYYKQNKLDKAIHYFSKAMEISPRDSARALKFAGLLMKKKKISEVEKVLRLVLKHNSHTEIKKEIVAMAAHCSLFDLAAKCLRSMLKDAPEHYSLHKKLGIVLRKKGELSQASSHLERAAERLEDDVDLMLILAQTYLDMGMVIRADKWAGKARRLAPDNKKAKLIMDKCI
jgi:CheY-like chemotaxis protein